MGTQDWRDLPALLAQDTLDQGPSAVNTGASGVRWGQAGGSVRAYVQTTLKPGATLLASAGQGAEVDPLAATWRVGLGASGTPATAPQAAVLKAIAGATGGSFDGATTSARSQGWGWQGGWPTLALLSLLYFLGWLAWRYLPGWAGRAGPGRLMTWWAWRAGWIPADR